MYNTFIMCSESIAKIYKRLSHDEVTGLDIPWHSDSSYKQWIENQLSEYRDRDFPENLNWLKLDHIESKKIFSPLEEGGTKSFHIFLSQILQYELSDASNAEFGLRDLIRDFWLDHFNVNLSKGDEKFVFPEFIKKIEKKQMGKFEDLLIAIYQTPNMMHYLDNRDNRKGQHNQNFAREVFELHVVGDESSYTLKDIEKLSIIMSGWTCRWNQFYYKDEFHNDLYDRRLSSIFNIPLKYSGQKIGENFLRELCKTKEAAQFLTKKLLYYFYGHVFPKSLHEKLTKRYLESKGNLRDVYLELFFSKEFMEAQFPPIAKDPVTLIKSLVKMSGYQVKDATGLFYACIDMGQKIHYNPDPKGYLNVSTNWITTTLLLKRLEFIKSFLDGDIKGIVVGQKMKFDHFFKKPFQMR